MPRVLFAGPDGKVNASLKNPLADKTSAYSYISAQEVIDMMRSVLKEYQSTPMSLMIEGIHSPSNQQLKPSSRLLLQEGGEVKGGGTLQFPADLDMDLPS